MGRDIFYFLSDFPFQLTWIIKSETKLEKEKALWIRRQERKRKTDTGISREKDTGFSAPHLTNDLHSLSNCDLIIETITEDFQKKVDLMKILDTILKSGAIITTNTSSIPIRSIVPSALRIENFIGLHFFYPVKLKNLAEVNRLPDTADTIIKSISEFLNKINRYFKVFDEENHFLVNRLFLPFQAEVYSIHKQEKISIKLLDDLVKETLFPIGVFDFFDQVGIDVMVTAISNYSARQKDNNYVLPLLDELKKMEINHQLGVKSGSGFYNYSNEPPKKTLLQDRTLDISQLNRIKERLFRSYLTTIFETVQKGIINRKDMEYIVMEYMGIEKSPFELAKEIGFTH